MIKKLFHKDGYVAEIDIDEETGRLKGFMRGPPNICFTGDNLGELKKEFNKTVQWCIDNDIKHLLKLNP